LTDIPPTKPPPLPATRPSIRLTEDVIYQHSRPRVDRENGIVHDVKVVGLRSKNGRRYLLEALREALHLYEGCSVNLEHPEDLKKADSRRFPEKFGWLEGCYVKDDGLWAKKLCFNPHHRYAEQFCWWAEHRPSAIGLSHVADGAYSRDRDGILVEQILHVAGVDVVGTPATTSGLYESMNPDLLAQPSDATPAPAQSVDELVGEIVKAIATDPAMDKSKKKAMLAQALKLLDDPETPAPVETPVPADDDAALEESLKVHPDPNVKRLLAKYEAVRLRESLETKRADMRKLCSDARLPEGAVTGTFIECLVESKDPQALIADRRRILSTPAVKSPTSATPGNALLTLDMFLESVKGK
jgi:hypothetical protein